MGDEATPAARVCWAVRYLGVTETSAVLESHNSSSRARIAPLPICLLFPSTNVVDRAMADSGDCLIVLLHTISHITDLSCNYPPVTGCIMTLSVDHRGYYNNTMSSPLLHCL